MWTFSFFMFLQFFSPSGSVSTSLDLLDIPGLVLRLEFRIAADLQELLPSELKIFTCFFSRKFVQCIEKKTCLRICPMAIGYKWLVFFKSQSLWPFKPDPKLAWAIRVALYAHLLDMGSQGQPRAAKQPTVTNCSKSELLNFNIKVSWISTGCSIFYTLVEDCLGLVRKVIHGASVATHKGFMAQLSPRLLIKPFNSCRSVSG